MHNLLPDLAICAGFLVSAVVGYAAGYNFRSLHDQVERLQQEAAERKEEAADEDTPAIIDPSPQLMREKQHHSKPEDEEESQIITVKSPRQLAADKANRERKELDKLTNGAIR